MQMHRALVVALVVVTAGSVGAQSITRWRTPDGRTYFGDTPPRGSTKLDTTYTPPPMGTASADAAAAVPAVHPSAPAPPPTDGEPQRTDGDVHAAGDGTNDAHQAKRPQTSPTRWR